jgi:plasmid stabilization system protein ParE
MNFTVIWKPTAIRQLTDAYLAGRRDRRGPDVTAALARIEVALQRDPLAVGESRSGRTRVLIDPPVLVSYTVHEQSREALILAVRYTSSHRP